MLCGVAAVVVTSAADAQKQAPPAAATPAPVVLPARRTYALSNGMKVTLAQYGSIPKAAVSLVVEFGDIDLHADQVWLADMITDLMLEGTTSRSGTAIAEEAAEMGGTVYAVTRPDNSSVGGEVLSDHAPELVRLVADVARNPKFPESEFPRIKADAIRQLSIQKSQQQSLAFEKFREVLYKGSSYGQVFPTEAMLRGYTIDQVVKLYRDNYNASRSHLYVVGRFDQPAVEKAIREAFGTWAGGKPVSRKPVTAARARTISVIDRPGAVQSTINVGVPVADPSSPDYTRLQVTNNLLGGSFGSRIMRNIREDKGYSYSPYSSLSSRYRASYWVEAADVTTSVTGPSLTEIFKEVDRLRAEPPTEKELDGTRNYTIGTFILGMNSRQGIISNLQFKDLHGLPDTYLTGLTDRIMAITPADVQRMAQKYLDPEKMTIVVVGDRKEIDQQLQPWTGGTP